jgi:murein DD-endopeptidase MepM/ murein hydrolase activator NlpD
MIAAAAGTVVAKYAGEASFRGIEIVLRHSPEETGIPLWIYTQYAHFSEMPALEVGQRVRMGEVLGPTGNTGIGRTGRQSGKRRPAIHFAVFYSTSDRYGDVLDRIIPVDGHWMDPVALFRKALPLDSASMKALPEPEKQVPISILFDDGEVFPAGSKIVWPYACARP